MRILITNLLLAGRSGTEVVTEQLADGFRRRGDEVAILTSQAGDQAAQLRWRGHTVCERADDLPWRPDIIHAHHNVMAMAAIARFPGVPVVFTCHDASLAFDQPPVHPAIRRWVAVDLLCRDRLIAGGVDPEAIRLVPNAVDEEAYPRRPVLPTAPRRALALAKNGAHLPAIKAACAGAALPLDVIGAGVGHVSDRLGAILPDYDLVFATARGALEAAFCGCAVVVADARGFAGRLGPDVLAHWRSYNFGRGILAHLPGEAAFSDAIAGYDPAGSAAVTDELRRSAGLTGQIEAFHNLYEEVLGLPQPVGEEDAARSLAAFIEDFVPTSDRSRGWCDLARDTGAGDLVEQARLEAIRAVVTQPLLQEVRQIASQPAEVTFGIEAFRTNIGERIADRIICNLAGAEGYAIFGPYAHLAPGRWIASFDLSWADPAGEEAIAELDVCAGETARLASGHVVPVPPSRGLIAPALAFEHVDAEQRLEFRIAVRGFEAGRLYFNGVRLTRVG